MKKVSFLVTDDRIAHFFTHPIRKNLHRLRELGYAVSITADPSPSPRALAADVVCVLSKRCSADWKRPETVFALVDKLRREADRVVWLDDSDSCGVTHFELLPVVDRYLKKQLYRDMTLYERPLYGDRLFTDFYHRRFGVTDPEPYASAFLDPALAHKVGLSWHIGLGDMIGDVRHPLLKRLRRRLPPTYPRRLHSPRAPRPLDFMFRGSRKYGRPTVSFHRERMGEILDAMQGVRAALRGFVSVRQYIRETMEAKIVVSPFGWGELGVRDFEALLYGAALMKPDMEHMRTFPELFVPGRTYQSIAWDFSDLESGIRELVADEPRRLALAEAGQQAYRDTISEAGMERFCEHFVRQLTF
ncbi:glycosyltransferase family protein [Solidesulfovibrio alcoholivorans]|uniref:glycosyltransferase family protein n=1 Tax=Solidesulfovibrio alcoholivorans TaxID=81406 RepID=UPI000497375B|nr:glycosyltransferase [Solidesulfovibrio alcoholivorans]